MSEEQNKAKPTGLQTYLRLLNYVKPHWFLFLIGLLGWLMAASAQPAFAWLIGYIVDALQQQNREGIFSAPIAFVSIVFVRSLGSFLGTYYLAKVANNVIHTLRCQIFAQYTRLTNAFFDSNSSGNLISRITYNTAQISEASTQAVTVGVREGCTAIGLLAYLLFMNWKLSLVFLIITPLIAYLVSLASKRFRAISQNIQTTMADITKIATEMLSGYRVMRSFGGENYEINRFNDASHTNARQSMKMVKAAAIHTSVLQLIVALALSALIYLALKLMTDASAGQFASYITAAVLLPKPIRQLTNVNTYIQKGIAAAESLFDIIDQPGEIDTGTYQVKRAAGKLEFDNLTFRYHRSEAPVLKEISHIIQPGQTVALVGHSGSGKTTLASLVPLFYRYEQGTILLDDVETKNYTLSSLRNQIALVTQHVTLFNDTVARNIAYGSLQNASRDEILTVAEAANAKAFIEQLPEGFDTQIGENGVSLSGGQRQRLAIARAFLKDAPVLILDEATSALDTESERQIQQALEKVMKNRTTIVIAHRLSTIENADVILVLDQGRIIERGKHQALLAKDGPYAQLHRLQFSDNPTTALD